MRPGVDSISPQGEDDAFMQLGRQMILAVIERFVKNMDEVRIAAAEYEKIVMFVTKVRGCYIGLKIGKEPQAELEESVTKIFKSIREIQ